MATIKPLSLKEFSTASEEGEQWRLWKEDFLNYIIATDYETKAEKNKIALFLLLCGNELKRKYSELNLQPVAPATSVTLQQIFGALDLLFQSNKSEIFASSVFWGLVQSSSETFDQFYEKVKLQAIDCNFGTALSRNIRDKLVFGIRDNDLRERLLREKELKEQDVVEQCRICELSHIRATAMASSSGCVDIVNRKKFVTNGDGKNTKFIDCDNCGRTHAIKKCPAFGKTCHKCGKMHHFESVCKSGRKNQSNYSNKVNKKSSYNKQLHELQSNEETNENFQLGIITIIDASPEINEIETNREWIEQLTLNDNIVSCKLDTGAHVNVISECVLNQWSNRPQIKSISVEIKAFGGFDIPIIGECLICCRTKKNLQQNLSFVVTKIKSKTIIGLQGCEQLNLVKRIQEIMPNMNKIESPEQIIGEFRDVFEGRGTLKRPVKIVLRENAVPHVAAARKIPIALHDRVRDELSQMVIDELLAKVEEPTDWVSSMVVIEKSGKLRIVLDPRPLNKVIKRSHYPIPNIEHLLSALQGNKYFTVLDAKAAFWQQPLTDESSFLTTFATPFGRYRWLVMPYGLNNAPEEFQRMMSDIFEKVPNVTPYIDDVAFASTTISEHCKTLRQILSIARQEGLKFNPEKIQLAKDKIEYLGQIVTSKGTRPNDKKVNAIKDYPTPSNRDELHRFLSMIQYHSKYMLNISNETHLLRQLLKKESCWTWHDNMQTAFDKLKQMLSEAPTLQLFDPKKEVTLSVDASQYGLGGTLMQQGRPVAFGSASLTNTQQRYSQIEKELLAIVFGLEHFNYYTYGRHLIVETDHRPLLGLSAKPYDTISPRLKRLLLRTNRYEFTLKYVPGKELVTADALSRAPLAGEIFKFEDEYIRSNEVCLIVTASPDQWVKLRQQTATDEALQDVLYHIQNGWPEKKRDVKAGAQQFFHCHDELYESNGIICRGQRFVVPKSEINRMLEILHVSHRGIVANKSRARENLYWPGMNTAIEDYVNRCIICQRHQRSNQHEPLLDRELPDRPWQKVAADFYDLAGSRYLLVVDYFSKYVEVQLMKGTTSIAVINAFKVVYSRHGIPDEMVSDQGPPYNSQEMADFHASWNINHNPSSPHSAWSNGQVERTIQTVKHSLKKAFEDGKDINLVLLDYRTTPSNDLPSPSELLMGRRLKTLLPTHPARLKPKFAIQDAKKALVNRQNKQKVYANVKTKNLQPLCKGDKVWFRLEMKKPWVFGIIDEERSYRTYLVQSTNGKKYIRNRYYIRLAHNDTNGDQLPIHSSNVLPAEVTSNDELPNLSSNLTSVPAASSTQIQVTPQQINPAPASPTNTPLVPLPQRLRNVNTPVRTRSGRIVKKPERYKN